MVRTYFTPPPPCNMCVIFINVVRVIVVDDYSVVDVVAVNTVNFSGL